MEARITAILTIATLTVLGLGLTAAGWKFALGFLAGVVLFQVAHRLRYGYWFE